MAKNPIAILACATFLILVFAGLVTTAFAQDVVSTPAAETATTTPVIDPSVEPLLSCPLGTTQVSDELRGTLHLGGGSPWAAVRRIDHPFSLTSNLPLTVVVASMVGHPERGCPASGSWVCNQGQSEEEFYVLVENVQVGYVPDHGEDRWEVFTITPPAVYAAADRTVSFVHTGDLGNNYWNSVGYKAIVCAG